MKYLIILNCFLFLYSITEVFDRVTLMNLVSIYGIFLLKVLWVIIKANLVLKSSFIFNYSYSAKIVL